MVKKTFSFSSTTVPYYFDGDFHMIEKLVPKEQAFILTDENVFAKHEKKFKEWKTIVIPAGEEYKVQSTVDCVILQLIEQGADRTSTLIGVGGGVVTDIAGYVAGIYMRGIKCGLVPTTILAMVDAAIGGKNGIDVGLYKNMVGIIRQPSFNLYDHSFLKSLPKEEWINGFAEIIKHACIKDASMFRMLEGTKLSFFQKNPSALADLIKRNAILKTKTVIADEFEKGERKLLNFGHSFGHAIENLYSIPHGHAVSIGMGVACKFSKFINGFKESQKVIGLLKQYGLPPEFDFDKRKILQILKSDKKKERTTISFIVLDKIGKASVVPLSFQEVEELLSSL